MSFLRRLHLHCVARAVASGVSGSRLLRVIPMGDTTASVQVLVLVLD